MTRTPLARRKRNGCPSPIKKVRNQLYRNLISFLSKCKVIFFKFPGGSLSNLSCLSDFESSASKSSSKNKKSRSSVSSRSREGGSLPPTKFENVMLYESSNSGHHNFAWDTGPQVSLIFFGGSSITTNRLLTGWGNDSNLLDCYVKFVWFLVKAV